MQKKKQAVWEHVNAGLQRRLWACRSRKAGRAWRLYPSRALLAVELLVGATGVELITQPSMLWSGPLNATKAPAKCHLFRPLNAKRTEGMSLSELRVIIV